MKFTFNKAVVAREIAVAKEIITAKDALSVLSNVLLSAKDGKLEIRATDVKTNFRTTVPVDIEEEGETTVLCDKFMGILSSLPDGDAEFTLTDKDNLTVAVVRSTAKRIKYNLNCVLTDKFPEPVPEKDLKFFNVPAKDLRQMISRTAFAVSADITRYFMSGVYFEKKDRKLVLVATDGRRLSYTEKEILPETAEFINAIVPTKILNIISRHFTDEGSVGIAVTDKMIFFRAGSYEFNSQLVDGNFPNYERVIPKEQTHRLVVSKDDLMSALKRISVMADKTNKILFEIKDGSLTVASKSMDYGDADDEIPAEYSGEEITIALNGQHVREPLSEIDSEKVVLEFTEALRAVTMRGDSDSGSFSVIMPMSL